MTADCNCIRCSKQALRRAFLADRRGWTPGRDDRAVLAAHAYLVQAGADLVPALSSIRVQPIEGDTFAMVVRDRRGFAILVDPGTAFYRAAADGDPLPLASVLLHEQYHVCFGPDERGAYALHLTFLRSQPGASADLVEFVEHTAVSNCGIGWRDRIDRSASELM